MFEFPEELAPLRRYLEKRHADVGAFASARQVAYTVQKLADLHVQFPRERTDSMLPTLRKIQEELLKRHRWLANPSKRERTEELRRQKPSQDLNHRQRVAAASAPNWIRTVGAAKFDRAADQAYRESRLGQFGAASDIKKIQSAEYTKDKSR